jgi:hypothetical protein
VTCSGGTCTFDGSGSTDDVGVVAYEWRLPSGALISTQAVFTKSTTSTGLRSITLTVRDGAGLTDSKTVTFDPFG